MPDFQLISPYEAAGDQPQAIQKLVAGLQAGQRHQTLLGATGTGKTFTVAKVIEAVRRPTLVMAHNKTLAAQLCNELRELFPNNAVEYFVSYYDYYQPEAYIPRSDTYIEKTSSINDEIDMLRHSATRSLLERRDVVVVASVSCIYGLGMPESYLKGRLNLHVGQSFSRRDLLMALVTSQYERNDIDLARGRFRVKGDVLELVPAYEENLFRLEFFGDEIEAIVELDPVSGAVRSRREALVIYPAKHFLTPAEELDRALAEIQAEMEAQVAYFQAKGKHVEAQRIEQRTNYDMEMLREVGSCNGVENYSRIMAGRAAGSPPTTLLDYFPSDFVTVMDESHVSIPQVRGMFNGDRARKEVLIEHGFRLPSALDNRPLRIEEFWARVGQCIFVSATPAKIELERSTQVVEQIIRPTGLLDPSIEVRPTAAQVDDLLAQVRQRVEKGQRALVTTLTKRMAEDLTTYMKEVDLRVRYLHSDIESLERIAILRDLRLGAFDVLVGVNLLREGLDLPEVSLMAILDADKEGFLRAEASLIQMIGRAARHPEGHVLMYADQLTASMARAIDETDRRRAIQLAHNKAHGIVPKAIVKSTRNRLLEALQESQSQSESNEKRKGGPALPKVRNAAEAQATIKQMERDMRAAAELLDFESAAKWRDRLKLMREAYAPLL